MIDKMNRQRIGGEGQVSVIKLMPQPELVALRQRKQRVATYCRVSTDDKEQLSSYQNQMAYYTDKIKTTPSWEFAGIFADEGITGTNALKRDEFQKMIRKCRRGGIDVILTKSISRFARNTMDCLKYIRELKGLGIAVIFEQGNINTMESESEVIITLLGALAQAESENISHNVKWGKQEAMREGKAIIQYNRFYAYEKGKDGEPKIIPEQAEVVRRIFASYLAGDSTRKIADALNRAGVPNVSGQLNWETSVIRSMLANEKYCGDVLMQKTFIQDCISRKVIKNTGQLPMYLIENHHEAIIDRQTFDAVQAETARRSQGKAISEKNSSTGLTRYIGKYALTQRLVCGDCGSFYVRCTWARNGQKRILWRCVKRRDYGTKFCANSPSLEESTLQAAILAALNSMVGDRDSLLDQVSQTLRRQIQPEGEQPITREQIQYRIEEIGRQTRALLREKAGQDMEPYLDQFKAFTDELAQLKVQMDELSQQEEADSETAYRMAQIETALHTAPKHLEAWDESTIRQLVEQVQVISANKIIVHIKGGVSVEQSL